MPRYFFDLYHGEECFRDEEGDRTSKFKVRQHERDRDRDHDGRYIRHERQNLPA